MGDERQTLSRNKINFLKKKIRRKGQNRKIITPQDLYKNLVRHRNSYRPIPKDSSHDNFFGA